MSSIATSTSRERTSPVLSNASCQKWMVYSVIHNVATYLDGEDILTAIRINKVMRSCILGTSVCLNSTSFIMSAFAWDLFGELNRLIPQESLNQEENRGFYQLRDLLQITNILPPEDEESAQFSGGTVTERLIAQNTGYLQIKEQLISVVKSLDKKIVKTLKSRLFFLGDRRLPHFVRNFFKLSRIEGHLDQVKFLKTQSQKNLALLDIFNGFKRYSQSKRALEVLSLIPSASLRKEPLLKFFDPLVKNDVEKAIYQALLIDDEKVRKEAVCCIFSVLMRVGSLEKVFEVAASKPIIENCLAREAAFSTIAMEIQRTHRIEEVIDLSSSFTDPFVKDAAFHVISVALLLLLRRPASSADRNKYVKKAFEFIRLISDESIRNHAITEVCLILSDYSTRKSVKCALQLVRSKEAELQVLCDLCSRIIIFACPEKALEVVQAVLLAALEPTSSSVLGYICALLVRNYRLSPKAIASAVYAREIARIIPDLEIRNKTVAYVRSQIPDEVKQTTLMKTLLIEWGII